MNWKEIDAPALGCILSTGEAQPMPRDAWPAWARTAPEFSGAWLYPVLSPPAGSTGALSTEHLNAYIDLERQADGGGAPLRYYRYFYARMADGRVFQAGPFKDLDYERHRDARPPWLDNYRSESTG